MQPPHGSAILHPAGYDVVEEVLEEAQVQEEFGVGDVARLVMWVATVLLMLYLVKKAVTKAEVVEEKVVKRGELMNGKILDAQEELAGRAGSSRKHLRLDPTVNTTAGKQNSMKIKPGSYVTVTDDLCPYNGKSLKVLRIDGELVECDCGEIGPIMFDTKYLKKTPTRIEIKWKVHGTDQTGSTMVDPFGACGEIFKDVEKTLGLKPFQFHLIFGGKKLSLREPAHAYCEEGVVVKVYIIPGSLEPGYKPPVEVDPGHATKIYEKLQRQCDEMEDNMSSGAAPPQGVTHGGFGELQNFIQKYDKVVVDFFAPWCGPCRRLAPEYQALSTSPSYSRIAFFTIDADSHRQAKSTYGITAFPTIKTFHKGRLYETMMGADVRRLETLLMNLDRSS